MLGVLFANLLTFKVMFLRAFLISDKLTFNLIRFFCKDLALFFITFRSVIFFSSFAICLSWVTFITFYYYC